MSEQHKQPKSDIEIAQAARMRPITEVGRDKLGIPADALLNYGPHKAKVSLDYIKTLESRPNGKLVLVTAITPTPPAKARPPQPSASATRSITSARKP